ncbi:hypothetical protein N2152v2_008020 [Parachlorella kessleri]
MTALMAERLGYDLPFLSQLLGPHRVEAQSDDGTGLLEQKLARTHDEGGQAEEGSTNPALAAATGNASRSCSHAKAPPELVAPLIPPGERECMCKHDGCSWISRGEY